MESLLCVLGFLFPLWWRVRQRRHHLTEEDLDELDEHMRAQLSEDKPELTSTPSKKKSTRDIDRKYRMDDVESTSDD